MIEEEKASQEIVVAPLCAKRWTVFPLLFSRSSIVRIAAVYNRIICKLTMYNDTDVYIQ